MFLMACGGDDDDAPTATATTSSSGSSGSTGATGSTGSTSATGSTGATGTTGATGATASTASSGLLHSPTATQGKPGGTLKHYSAADATHFDSVADSSGAVVSLSSSLFYPRMLRMKSVPVPGEADGSSEGELAESWEVSPDRLSITFKIRQGMVWDRRDPTNGRQINADDVVFSWEKYKGARPGLAHCAA
jgi:ABC-type transport system substrate-binding protein